MSFSRCFRRLNKKTEDYEVILIGLKRDREDLYERINNRVDKIVKSGLTEEMSGLLAMGLTIASSSAGK